MKNISKIKKVNKSTGFIALFSVIIISFILVLVSVNLSYFSFSARFNLLDSESKVKSKALAESCQELARLALAFDNNYLVNNITIDINEDNCNYSVLNTPPYQIILSHSVVNNAHTYLKTEVDATVFSIPIISYQELPNPI